MAEQAQPVYPPSYLNEYNGNQVVTYSVVFLILQTVFLSLRFLSRWLGKVQWGLDDTFVVAAVVFQTGLITACLCDVVYGGVGHHIVRVIADDPHKLVIWWKFNLVVPLLYFIAVALPKLSILALYFRVFGRVNNTIPRTICWISGGLVVGNCLANVLVTFFMCRPLAFTWNKNLPGGGTCVDIMAWWRWSSLANIITDVIMLLLPIPEIRRLQVPNRVKAGLAVTFITGSIGLVTALIRFVGFFTKNYAVDSTWTGASLLYLSIIEPGLYIIASCLLSLRPLLKWTLERSPLTSLKSGSKSGPRSDNNSHIMQKMSFKVSQSERFQELGDSEELVGGEWGHNKPGHRTEVGTGMA